MTKKPLVESEAFLSSQLITYLGNKRSLLEFIDDGLTLVKTKIKKRKLTSLDLFSGSGVVSRYLKRNSNLVISNDLESYSEIINKCYMTDKINISPQLDIYFKELSEFLAHEDKFKSGFIQNLYAPKNSDAIIADERCFFTTRNAKYLDTARQLISKLPDDLQPFLLAPLLSEASIHANTSGVFKGFYKNTETGLGQFGGNNKNALTRICGNIQLKLPVLSNFNCVSQVYREDANTLIHKLDEVDIAYIDPPYNQHPYSSNYFMLNLLTNYVEPINISKVSGIPEDWNRSLFNKKDQAIIALTSLVNNIKAKFLLISFSDDGFISKAEMMALLNTVGTVTVLEKKYNTFKGSKNLKDRNLYVKEYLYVVAK
jgi:adenine-specific DNA-methyltransferase